MERNPTRLGTGKEKVVVVGGVRNSGNFFYEVGHWNGKVGMKGRKTKGTTR